MRGGRGTAGRDSGRARGDYHSGRGRGDYPSGRGRGKPYDNETKKSGSSRNPLALANSLPLEDLVLPFARL